MAKDVITRFKLETTQYDSKIKNAAKELSDIAKSAKSAGADFERFTKDSLEAARSLGTIATSSVNAKDRAKELVGAFNDVARSYNQLTEEQKNSDFGKAVADSLTHLQQRIRETKEEMKGLEAGGDGLFGGGKLDGMLQVFGGNLMTKGVELATSAVTSLISETGDMIRQGVELAKQGEGIRIAFERMGRGDILQGLREATHGTVTDLELMKAAVKFNDFKLPLEELGTMLAFAQQKAKDTGQSVDYMVDSIVTGLGRKSLMILDNLGLSATEIRERMKETGDMTKAVGAIIRDQMAAAGDYVETAADRAAQANVSLQNKMEELGRKFAPVEEASNHLWTSMKIGILDIIGGPLATLLNQLTEAGRLKNALNDINGDGSNGNTVVGGKLKQLQAAKNSGASQYMLNTMQSSTIEGYNRQITKADELLKQFEKNHSSVNVVLQNATKQFGQKFSSISELEAFRDAYKVMVSDYRKGASEIMKPVKVNVNTQQSETNIKKLRQQLKELEEQRKKAVEAGDQEQVDNLTKQISQTKTNLGYLDPSATKGAKAVQDDFTEIIGLIGNAQERVSDLQRQIRESWDQNEITTLNQKLKDAQNELDVLMGKLPKDTVVDITVDVDTAKALQKIGDIEGITIAPKTVEITATDEALPELVDIEGITITPKTFAITATDEAMPKLREIQGVTIDPKTSVITATDEALPKLRDVQGVTIEPKTFAITATDEALPKLNKIDGITINPKTVTITATDEAMPKLRDIEGVTIDPKTLAITATDEAMPKLREIQGVTIDPKTSVITATDEALPKLREIQGMTIEPKTFAITATDEAMPKLRDIQGVTIEPKNMTVTADTTEALKRVQELIAQVNGTMVEIKVEPVITDEDIEHSLREQYGKPIEVPITPMTAADKLELEVRTKLSDQNIEADMQTLRTLMEAQIKNGIEGIEIPTGFLIEKIMGEGVPDEYWKNLQDQINEKLKELGIEPIKINFETGNIANVGKETEKSWRGAASAMGAAGSALQGLEDPGAKIAGIVGQAIANIALGFAQATTAVAAGGPFAWIAAISGGLATMLSTISAIHSATGYAQGGIVDGRGGGFVGGMAYSGDNVGNVRLDSGELVLNRAQQNNLANALEGGNNNNVENRQPYVNGELIYLGLNNYLKRTGRGEIVVSKR